MKNKNPNIVKYSKTASSIAGQNIRTYRQEANWSQMKLASESGLDLCTIHRIETAKVDVTLSSLSRIKEALGVNWNSLLADV